MSDDDDRKAKILANITRALGKIPGVVVRDDGDKILAFKRSEPVPPRREVDLLRDILGLEGADAALLKAKWELMRIVALAIDEHGIAIDEIAADIGETPETLQRWLDYVVRDVPFERLAAVHHAVAERAELWPLEWLIGGKPGE